MKKRLKAGDLVVMRTRKNEDSKVLEWLNVQEEIGDAIRYLIEQDIQQNGIRDLSQILVKTRLVLPSAKNIEEPLLKKFYENRDEEVHISDFYDPLAEYFNLDENIRNRKATTTSEPQWNNNVRWAKEFLKNKGFVESTRRGYWKITKKGCDYVEKNLL